MKYLLNLISCISEQACQKKKKNEAKSEEKAETLESKWFPKLAGASRGRL